LFKNKNARKLGHDILIVLNKHCLSCH